MSKMYRFDSVAYGYISLSRFFTRISYSLVSTVSHASQLIFCALLPVSGLIYTGWGALSIGAESVDFIKPGLTDCTD